MMIQFFGNGNEIETNPWWKGAVLYQIYPRSFLDTNADGIGDLPGITKQLEYVASIGVDGVWISPFFRSPMKDFGYDVADYCDAVYTHGNHRMHTAYSFVFFGSELWRC
jgi:hypothetical protein